MNPLRPWLRWYRRKQAQRRAQYHERRRLAILRQISEAQDARREWKPKLGDLQAATLAALRAENRMV
ncbi:hypothetical protein [Pseudohoeflea coraliihabitans]|uniref:Uncharacterized protein n=1 Tax=Pseudohoeflea coraliihabitans TaxID=2860393 RepID=A0ABS6WIA0_9HYPH|nr:hypothetical protein [Pseudohoeflea sp. DP4N28-3]MBW3095678.1 hypothetical protein [Pseudohoeflea sp. DP4N28-3]